MGCDLANAFGQILLRPISIHAPTWGATLSLAHGLVQAVFQSTHPRGVRLRMYSSASSTVLFQSTHPRGVRHGHIWLTKADAKFQSTHPRGVRRTANRMGRHSSGISIHAPTWGATSSSKKVSIFAYHFNPRTHVGCDVRLSNFSTIVGYFNPRTHVGCDIHSTMAARQLKNFNPRTHVGCDC